MYSVTPQVPQQEPILGNIGFGEEMKNYYFRSPKLVYHLNCGLFGGNGQLS